MDESALDKNMKETLRELGHRDRSGALYWWRQASCKKLSAIGLAEPIMSRGSEKRRPYRLTDAGREMLRSFA